MIKIISGKVIDGKKIGKKLGYPTANIELEDTSIDYGVYKINVIIKGEIFAGAGFYGEENQVFESYIFDFNEDIYGINIEVILLKKIRENKIFDSEEKLIIQIKKDIDNIKKIEFVVLTFGTFDILHPGHEYYLKNAKKYADKLITIIGTDKNVEKIKGKLPINSEEIRFMNLQNMKISNFVIIGDEKDPYKLIKHYNPQVICLGYDQKYFVDKLNNFIKNNNLNIEIIRLLPYREHKYKSSIIGNK